MKFLLSVGVWAVLLGPAVGEAQTSRGSSVGIVTTLNGQATVTRADRPAQSVPLKFKDEVYFKDRISTKQHSIARVLLGGKSLVTVRELSDLTITEEPGRPSILDLFGGKIALAVAKLRMRPGESIEVRTPNAVAAVRGTVLVVDITTEADTQAKPRRTSFKPSATPVQSKDVQTTFYNISTSPGSFVDVKPLSGKTALGDGVTLGPGQEVTANVFGIGLPTDSPPGRRGEVLANMGAKPPDTKASGAAAETIANTGMGQARALTDAIFQPPTSTPVNTGVVQGGTGCGGSGESACEEFEELQSGGTVTTDTGGGGGGPPPVGNPGPLPLFPPQLPPQSPAAPAPITPAENPTGLPVTNYPALSKGANPQASFGTTLMTCDDCSTGSGGQIAHPTLPFTFPFQGGNFTNVEVSSNGFLSPTNSTTGIVNGNQCCNGDVAGFLSGSPRISPAWFDLLPGLAGSSVQYNNQLTGRAVFTWNAVPEFPDGSGSQSRNTFQAQLFSDGRIIFLYPSVTLNSHNALVGVTPGGGVTDPGNINFNITTSQASTGTTGTVYELFTPSTGVNPFDLNGQFIIFAPHTSDNGWDVLDPPPAAVLTLTNGEVVVRDRPLLEATNSSQLLIGGVALVENGQLIVTDPRPLVSLTGETHSLGIFPGLAMFDLIGTATAIDAETGLEVGMLQPLQHAGEMVRLDNAVASGEQLVKLDRALLEATAPLLNMMNGSAMVSSNDLVNLANHAKMTANLLPGDALVQLNASRLTVNNGSLFNVANSSVLNVTGSLVSLANGSFLNILNGGLLNVSGNSVANITGSLFSFTGANNSVAVNNSFRVTNTINGISFFQGPGATVNILPTATLRSGTGTGTISGAGPLIIAQGAGTRVTVQ